MTWEYTKFTRLAFMNDPEPCLCRHSRCYYYEEAVMLYGFYNDGDWKFGLKDRTMSNGHKICVQTPTSLYMYLEEANFPI